MPKPANDPSVAVAQLMHSLPARLRPSTPGGWRATFHFRLSHCAHPEWTVRVEGDRCTVAQGLEGAADCTVETSAETLAGIAAGTVNPRTAFLLRRVKVSHLGPMLKFIDALGPPGTGEPTTSATPALAQGDPPSPGEAPGLPLADLLVLDCSRMLPGAVLARQLLELGARVIKIEDAGGDPMRHAPPLVDGIGAGFVAFYRGAQSVILDLRTADGAATLRALARRADVLVESFRPGTLARWGVGLEALRAANPALVTCSLSGYGGDDQRPAHDLNVTAESGLLSLLGGPALPAVLLADVAAGLLAATAILAALLARRSSGRGAHIEQPLATALRPFLAWPAADLAAGADGLIATHLAGACPAYRRYRCGDGGELVVAAVEPKFWTAWVELLGLPHLAGVGLDPGDDGAQAAAQVAAVLAQRPRQHWLERGATAGLPVSPVLTLAEALAAGTLEVAEPLLPGVARGGSARAPALGEHTAAVRAELAGISLR
jgi:crotonobetainyl-CoA:carnitine CoA-transferase CaiB-like acyl-CoA transferase